MSRSHLSLFGSWIDCPASLRRAVLAMCMVGAVAILGVPRGAMAMDVRAQNSVSVPASTSVADDLLASGSTVTIQGAVQGDAMAVGSQIDAGGRVGSDALLLGAMVRSSGSVGNSLWAAGNTVRADSKVTRNAALAGSSVSLTESASVGSDLYAAGASVRVDGNVGRNARVAGGVVTINGRIGGDLYAQADNLVLGPSAVVAGDLKYTSPKKATIDPGARVLGRTDYTHRAAAEKKGRGGVNGGLAFLSLLALYATGAVMLWMMPHESGVIAAEAIAKPWASLLVGFLTLVAVPVAVLLLMLTIIGAPLGLILLAGYLISLYLAKVFIALAFGRLVMPDREGARRSDYLRLLVGVVILIVVTTILGLIPVIGPIVNLLILLIGFGALLRERYSLAMRLKGEGRM